MKQNTIEIKKMRQRIRETNTYFFWKNKQNWHAIGPTNKKNEINKIRNEKGDVTTDTAEIKRITRNYDQQHYANKLEIPRRKK